MSSKNHKENSFDIDLDSVTIILIMCFKALEKWTSWKEKPFKTLYLGAG